MLFSSGSSIYGRESAEVPENKANIPNICRECKFLLHGLGISTLVTWYVYRATQCWSIKGQHDPYRPQHILAPTLTEPSPTPFQQETSTRQSEMSDESDSSGSGCSKTLPDDTIKAIGSTASAIRKVIRENEKATDVLKYIHLAFLTLKISVGKHGDDKGHHPDVIGRNIGKKCMGGQGINVGNQVPSMEPHITLDPGSRITRDRNPVAIGIRMGSQSAKSGRPQSHRVIKTKIPRT
ncbi:hypothetical protein N7489_008683 [Penicillium chrysogenum]|uniref:Uncharacterized protein n=1 Tax=Penicillium chrysogenum TaxID=5076 RepID=A0ABQ8WZJ9_PENCH|nr:uncharacterized protein N7489_008683 [Penicillium chrysogenum]KAJ5227975.1 hypothetical protein N7489_008683 [Penicillium chrysogenum]KAJ5284394.1 hypothetical protein N7505_002374 [Penicillium chrysogenum]KAJ5286301.1 hypothetical protein N7524_001607 [Penicillium chrysogenum]KAJ6167478.1 hypothetical protein N7497_000321 [Penicillium chrysogenum]